MKNANEQRKTVVSGEFTFPIDAKTSADGIGLQGGSFVAHHVFSAISEVESTSLVRINKRLSGDFSRLGRDTKGTRTRG